MNIDIKDMDFNEDFDNFDDIEPQNSQEEDVEYIKASTEPIEEETNGEEKTEPEVETNESEEEETSEEAKAEPEEAIDYKAEYERILQDNETLKKRQSDSSRGVNLLQNEISTLKDRLEKITSLDPSQEELISEAKNLFPSLDWEKMTEAQKTTVNSYVENIHAQRAQRLKMEIDAAITRGELQMEKICKDFPIVSENKEDFIKFVNEKDPDRKNLDLSLYAELFEARKIKEQSKKPKTIQKNSLMGSTISHEIPKPKLDINKVKILRETNPREYMRMVTSGELDELDED